MNSIKDLALHIDKAAHEANAVAQLTKTMVFTEMQAYEIQKMSIDQRLSRGEIFTGIKMGFTSRAKMEQMGVHDMIWGRLTNQMFIENGATIDFSKYVHPRAEPEIAFLVKKRIEKEVGMDEIKSYIKGVAAAIEVIDSRYENFKFSLEDVIADNCSSSGYALGQWLPVDTEVNNLKMQLIINDETVQEGDSSAILGNPWESVQNATRLCEKFNQPLNEGDIILAGAATPAVYLKQRDTVKVAVEGLDGCGFLVS